MYVAKHVRCVCMHGIAKAIITVVVELNDGAKIIEISNTFQDLLLFGLVTLYTYLYT